MTRRELLRVALGMLPAGIVVKRAPNPPSVPRKHGTFRFRVCVTAKVLALTSTWSANDIRDLADRITRERRPSIGRKVRVVGSRTGFHDPERERELHRLLGVLGQLPDRDIGGWYAVAKLH
ncbi:MAG TPA: hypothetical protein PKK06_13070 [Phycisphaerae bacterium]|nr:hypothetical protein [Phycisphaerae bacterium]HNU44409.1 hypothetical protein [Phycisphaerae bacterium]